MLAREAPRSREDGALNQREDTRSSRRALCVLRRCCWSKRTPSSATTS